MRSSHFSYQLTATDIDAYVIAETLSYEAVVAPDWITISPSGLITGTPENEHVGEHTVTVKVTDSAGASDTKTFIITVNAVNEAPTVLLLSEPEAGLEEFYFFEGEQVSFELSASDPDGDALSINISGDASNYLNITNSELINISGIAPAITGQGYQNGIKEDLFTITVIDPSGASSNVDVEYLILENRTHFFNQKINGELIVGETVSPEFTPLDPQGIKSSPSVSWYSSLNSDGSYKSFLGSGLDGDWKLNSEQYGHYLGTK